MKLILFTAPWCGPCKTYKPLLRQTAADVGVELEEVNIEEDRARAGAAQVRAVPTTVLVDDNGNEVKRVVGAHTRTALEAFLSAPR